MRTADTYRGRRRNDWSAARKLALVPWREWNVTFHGRAGFSIPARVYPPTMARTASRSKYMPHIGAKERGRYASK
jgi:hypothetical protein